MHGQFVVGYCSKGLQVVQSSTKKANSSTSKSKPLVCSFYEYLAKLAHRCETMVCYLISMDQNCLCKTVFKVTVHLKLNE
jgi:hypothetical protein